jgi:formyltetrahydrofolate synthetase
MNNEKIIEEYTVKTKRGYPALWEAGGGFSNTGHSRIIADRNGNAKKPVYIRTGGDLAGREHALFTVEPGDVVVDLSRHHEDYDIEVKQIRSIKKEGDELIAEMILLAHFDRGEWDNDDIAEKYRLAIESAKKKSRMYHCRSPVYYKE